MAHKQVTGFIQISSSTREQWLAMSHIIPEGVLVFANDTNKLYIGNGIDVFADLIPLNQDVYTQEEIDNKIENISVSKTYEIITITNDSTLSTNCWYMVDLSSKDNINLTLPAEDLEDGDTIIIQDSKLLSSDLKTITVTSTDNIGIGRKNISTGNDTFIINVSGAKIILTYNVSFNSWDIRHEELLNP
jgi:hypothetical protein